jgi:hypothetical protein
MSIPGQQLQCYFDAFQQFYMRRLCILSSFFICTFPAHPQSQERAYATLIVNFARGIQWPSNSIKEKFIIGVMEYDPLSEEIESMVSNMKVNGKVCEVRRINTLSDIDGCQIFFLPAFKGKMLQHVLDKVQSTPVLVITNKIGLAKNGSSINFLLINGKLQYEINFRSIESRGMKVSATIRSLGIEVSGG